MGFAANEMLGIGLKRHVIEQVKAPNCDALLDEIDAKALPVWPPDIEKGEKFFHWIPP
jgi:hypothetical protein